MQSTLSLTARPDAVPGDVALGWGQGEAFGVFVLPAWKAEDYAKQILVAVAQARAALAAPKEAGIPHG